MIQGSAAEFLCRVQGQVLGVPVFCLIMESSSVSR